MAIEDDAIFLVPYCWVFQHGTPKDGTTITYIM
jgi:hypothetical protein